MSRRLSAPQREVLDLLASRSRVAAAHTRDGYVSAIVVRALIARGLAEYDAGYIAHITDAGRAIIAAAGGGQ